METGSWRATRSNRPLVPDDAQKPCIVLGLKRRGDDAKFESADTNSPPGFDDWSSVESPRADSGADFAYLDDDDYGAGDLEEDKVLHPFRIQAM